MRFLFSGIGFHTDSLVLFDWFLVLKVTDPVIGAASDFYVSSLVLLSTGFQKDDIR